MIPTAQKLYRILERELEPGEVISSGKLNRLGKEATPHKEWRERAIKELVREGFLKRLGDFRFRWNPASGVQTKAEGARRGREKEGTYLSGREREAIVFFVRRPGRLRFYAFLRENKVAYTHEMARFFGMPLATVHYAIRRMVELGIVRKVAGGEGKEIREEVEKKREALASHARNVSFFTLAMKNPLFINTEDHHAHDFLGEQMLEAIEAYRSGDTAKEERKPNPEKVRMSLEVLLRKWGKAKYNQLLSIHAKDLGISEKELDEKVKREIKRKKKESKKGGESLSETAPDMPSLVPASSETPEGK